MKVKGARSLAGQIGQPGHGYDFRSDLRGHRCRAGVCKEPLPATAVDIQRRVKGRTHGCSRAPGGNAQTVARKGAHVKPAGAEPADDCGLLGRGRTKAAPELLWGEKVMIERRPGIVDISQETLKCSAIPNLEVDSDMQ